MVCRINHRPDFAPVLKYASKASKSAELVASSLSALTPDEMIAEFQQLARLNSRCKQACVHVVLSPAAGEQLTGEQWREICEKTARELGATQWVGFVHHDTAIPHVSLVLSRIGPDGRAWSTCNDRYRMRSLCRAFEEEHGLRQTPERSHDLRVNKTEIEKAQRLHHAGERSNAVPDRMAIAVAVRAALRQPTLRDFESCLTRQGITTRWRHDETGRSSGVSYGRGEACISGTHAGVSAQMLSIHYGNDGTTTTHEQSRRIEMPGGTSPVDVAAGPGDRKPDPDRPAGQHPGLGGGPQTAAGFGGGPGDIFGDAQPIRQVGELVVQALSRVARMCDDMARDGQRFDWEQTRKRPLRPPPRFVPRTGTINRNRRISR